MSLSHLPGIKLDSKLGKVGLFSLEGPSLDQLLGALVVGKPFTIISCFCHRWVFGWIGCRWYGWAGFFFGCGSLITMTAVSLDRYLKICYLSYGKQEGFQSLIVKSRWIVRPLHVFTYRYKQRLCITSGIRSVSIYSLPCSNICLRIGTCVHVGCFDYSSYRNVWCLATTLLQVPLLCIKYKPLPCYAMQTKEIKCLERMLGPKRLAGSP